MLIVYYSGVSEFTHRFVQRLDTPSVRIGLYYKQGDLHITEPYILMLPTYGTGTLKTAIPPQVKRFLKDEENQNNCTGVIGAGNTNFGGHYCLAAELIARRFDIPLHHKFELLGTEEDVTVVNQITANKEKLTA